jgi:AraC-like DNA-binding protein
MAGDILSDVLRTVRLTGAVYFDVVASEPWVAEQPDRAMVLPKVLPGAEHLISYHVVLEGSCFASVVGAASDGRPPIKVDAGEVVVFTKGDAHVMSSQPGMRAAPVPSEAFDALAAGPLPFAVSYGGPNGEYEPRLPGHSASKSAGPTGAKSGGRSPGQPAKLVCGFLACDAAPFNPLLDQLPAVIKIGARPGSNSDWLGQFIGVALGESDNKRAGAESVLAKLSELMFIEVVRRYIETMPPDQTGWLAGLRDQFVGKALSLLHASPARDWTIEELARDVGLSRSVLAERFADLLGMGPMHYLAQWRMQIASGMLSGSTANIATIAEQTGYGSEAAFSRAFKKVVGMPPSAWRQRKRA